MNIVQPFLARAGATVKGALRVLSTGAARMPVGTTAERPAIEDGLIRFNSTTGKWEKSILGTWKAELSDAEIVALIQATANLTLSTPTLTSPSMSTPSSVGGTFATPSLVTPTSSNGTFTTPTLVNPINNQLTLTDAPTTTWNMNNGHVARWAITATGRTLAAPTNIKVGGQYVLLVSLTTPSTMTPTWPSIIAWPYGTPPDLTTTNWSVITLVWSADHAKLLGSYTPGY